MRDGDLSLSLGLLKCEGAFSMLLLGPIVQAFDIRIREHLFFQRRQEVVIERPDWSLLA